MSDFLTTYALTRARFDEAVLKLSTSQLNFRMNSDVLTAGEMAFHVAGVEVWFAAQLLGTTLDDQMLRIATCATDGSINDNPFPFTESEITPEFVSQILAVGRAAAESVFKAENIRNKELASALGPIINGEGAMVRLCSHPFYHQGQIYMITTAEGFPR
jgi:hypothetical protein